MRKGQTMVGEIHGFAVADLLRVAAMACVVLITVLVIKISSLFSGPPKPVAVENHDPVLQDEQPDTTRSALLQKIS